MTNMKKILALVLALCMVVALVACGKPAGGNTNTPGSNPPASNDPDTSNPPASQTPELGRQTIKIGIATCFTGNGARGAETQLYGLQVALDQINASGYSKYYDFELVKGDDMYDATEAVAVANKMVYQDGVKAVFGHLNAVVTLAGLSVYEEAHVPCFTPSGSSDKVVNSGYEYVYLCVPQDRIIAASLINHLVDDLGLTKLGMLYCNNDAGQSGLEFCENALAEKNMEFADKQTCLISDTDFTGQLLSMKGNGVQAVVVWGVEASLRAIVVQQARQLINTDVIVSGDATFSNASFISVTEPSDREGVVYPAAWSPAFTDEASTTFVKEFMALDPLKSTPGAVTVRFYDGMYLLATALNNMGPYDADAEDFTEKLNEAIKAATYEGLQGTLTPAANGECLEKCYIVRYNAEGNEELVQN